MRKFFCGLLLVVTLTACRDEALGLALTIIFAPDYTSKESQYEPLEPEWWRTRREGEIAFFWRDNLGPISWRGRQIEEVVSYWGPPTHFTEASSHFLSHTSGYFMCVRNLHYKYNKINAKYYYWHTRRPPAYGGHNCFIWFMVNDKGKIIAHAIETMEDDLKCEVLEKPSTKDYPNKNTGNKSIWNWDIGYPNGADIFRYPREEYVARFSAGRPGSFDAVVESWMGHRMDELVRAWGKPMRSWAIDHTNRTEWEKDWKPKLNFPKGVVKLNRWLIMDHTWPPPPSSVFYDPAEKHTVNLRNINTVMCYTAFGADDEGKIIWAGRKEMSEGENGYFKLPTGYGCELLMADGRWSPKMAPAKP